LGIKGGDFEIIHILEIIQKTIGPTDKIKSKRYDIIIDAHLWKRRTRGISFGVGNAGMILIKLVQLKIISRSVLVFC
jgi:hypothetical protein